ncbi:MAG: tetratricopeptide repeat protein [Methylovulum sp.]|uniref:SEL1-like repeat protein n=2 Tax=Methylovulum sp. TaxID=1916980 RepID=UPI002638B21E|nr:tetratricopeptide repeat protein [Methylovulum sp.]MDD2724981.1 tetratricopeptide repeat protein [Methylovulum sp.]
MANIIYPDENGNVDWNEIRRSQDQDNFNQYKKNAEQGDMQAQYKLAENYLCGTGVEQNFHEAVKWFQKVAQQGDSAAQGRLGDCYYYGRGVEQNYSEAIKWYEKVLITKGSLNFTATKNLTECYIQKNNLAKMVGLREKEVKWLEEEIKSNNQYKKCRLQEILPREITGLKKIYSNLSKANPDNQLFPPLENAIEQKCKTVENDIEKNIEELLAPIRIRLAECYKQGLGVQQNSSIAIEHLRKAADKQRGGNDKLAQRKLAIHFFFKENYEEACKYFDMALRDNNNSLEEYGQSEAELGIFYYYRSKLDQAIEYFINSAIQKNNAVGILWLAYVYNKYLERTIELLKAQEKTCHRSSNIYVNFSSFEKLRGLTTDSLLRKTAASLFLKNDEDCNDSEMLNYAFPVEIIQFLENQNSSPAHIVLAFYYQCQEEKEKYLVYLEQASSKDMLGSYLLGKYHKNTKNFDKAILLFEQVEKNQIEQVEKNQKIKYSPIDEKKATLDEYDLTTQQFLVYSAQEEISNIGHQREIEKTNNYIKDANHRMQRLVEQFTHSLGNVIFPDTIYQVAERLKNNPECRKDVLLLHEAYHSEIIIKLQGELLRQRYTNTNPEKFRQFIRSCRRTPNSAENTKSIEDILDYAASRVTARFLNQHYAGLNSIRDKMLSKKNISLDALKQKFEDDILLNKSLRPIAWINQNLRPIQIAEISPLWKKVFMLSESHAEALLFGYFSEILFNAFKYADHDKDEFLRLDFDEKTINDKTYLTCSWLNPVKDKSPAMLGTGKGLDAIQEDLKQLNDTVYPEESLLIFQQNNQFQVTLFFKKDLLVNDLPSLKIKRKANVE